MHPHLANETVLPVESMQHMATLHGRAGRLLRLLFADLLADPCWEHLKTIHCSMSTPAYTCRKYDLQYAHAVLDSPLTSLLLAC